jgi:hypothetical protein
VYLWADGIYRMTAMGEILDRPLLAASSRARGRLESRFKLTCQIEWRLLQTRLCSPVTYPVTLFALVARFAKYVISADVNAQPARKYTPISKLLVLSLIQPTTNGPT